MLRRHGEPPSRASAPIFTCSGRRDTTFAHGLPLYQPLPGARHFNYPPFAAQVFQVLGLFPLKTAAGLFYVVSVGLILLAVWVSRDIIQRRLQPSTAGGSAAGAGGSLLCRIHAGQHGAPSGEPVDVRPLLLGVQAFISKREFAAGGWLVAATAIKLTPVFFLVWAVIRGSRRTLAAIAVFGVLCLMLPVIQRGLAQGSEDLTDYYGSFLQEFAAGGVITNYRNQNLAALVYRAVTPAAAEDVPPYEYAYLPSLAPAAPLIYRVLALAVLAAFLAHLVRLRLAGRQITALEISSVFLASHLLSGITWKAHLVTLLFVFYAFFALELGSVGRVGRWAWGWPGQAS